MKPFDMASDPSATVSPPQQPGSEDAPRKANAAVPADIRGPSVEDWDRHKRTIINMYGTMRLRDIRERMATDHGFHATYVISNASIRPPELNVRAYVLNAGNECTIDASTNGVSPST